MRLSIVIKLCIPIRHACFIFSVLYTDKCTVNKKKLINKWNSRLCHEYLKQVQFDFHLLCCSYKGWSLHSARKQTIILGVSLTPNHLHTIFSILQIAYFFLPLTPIIWSLKFRLQIKNTSSFDLFNLVNFQIFSMQSKSAGTTSHSTRGQPF